MKKSEGFTLIEVLAILLILGIIVTLTISNMSVQIKQKEKNEQNVLFNKIGNASKIYASKYFADKLIDREEVTFSINDLLQDGVLTLSDSECNDESDREKSIEFLDGNIVNAGDVKIWCDIDNQ